MSIMLLGSVSSDSNSWTRSALNTTARMSELLKKRAIEALGHALAGSFGGLISSTITYPLAAISTRMQAQSKTSDHKPYKGMLDAMRVILREEGVLGLYAGYKSAVVGIVSSQGIYYYWYALFGFFFQRRSKHALGTLESLIVSALAGCMTAIFTNPIWVVNTRMTTQRRDQSAQSRGVVGTLLQLLQEDGVTALFRGLVPALILVANPVIQFALFERLKALLTHRKPVLTAFDYFWLGALTKLAATFITYPYIVVKTRLQVKQSEQYRNTTHALQQIWSREGLAGFYKGLNTKLVHSVLTAAIIFLCKEKLVYYTMRLLQILRLQQASQALHI